MSGTSDPIIEKLSKLENITAILRTKLGDPLVNTWVMEASRFSGPFACYDDFLPSVSPRGDPLCYDPQDFMASRAIVSLLHDSLSKVPLISNFFSPSYVCLTMLIVMYHSVLLMLSVMS